MTITTKFTLIGILLIGLTLTFFAYRRSTKAVETQSGVTPSGKYMLLDKTASKPENLLFISILEQLGDVFHVQFGTSLQSILMSTGLAGVPEGVIDILLVDPEDLTPKLAIFLTDGGGIWSGDIKGMHLTAIEALQGVGVTAISVTRQDHYQTSDIVKQILDSLDDAAPYY